MFAETDAWSFAPFCYRRFGSLDDRANFPLSEMQAWLEEERTPIAIVVQMMDGWINYRGENRAEVPRPGFPCDVVESRSVCLEATGTDLRSQHMMTLIGYDNEYPSRAQYPSLPAEKRGSFLVINQWGEKWGDQGLMWIPYSELRKIWIAGYGIQPNLARAAGVQRRDNEPECVQAESGAWQGLFEADDVPENLVGGAIVTTATLWNRDIPTGSEALPSIGTPPSDTADWYYFDTSEPVWVSLHISAFEDVILKVTDDRLRLIGQTDLSPSGDLQVFLPQPGRYFAKVFEPLGRPVVYALLAPTFTPAGTASKDDDIRTARPMLPIGSMSAKFAGVPAGQSVGTYDDTVDRCDWWKLTAPESGTIEVLLRQDIVPGDGTNDQGNGTVMLDGWQGETPDGARLVEIGVRPTADWKAAVLTADLAEGDCLYLRVHTAAEREVTYDLSADFVIRSRDGTPGGARSLVLVPDANGNVWKAVVRDHVGPADSLDYYRFRMPWDGAARVELSGIGNGEVLFFSVIPQGLSPGDTEFVRADSGDLQGPAPGEVALRGFVSPNAIPRVRDYLLVVGARQGSDSNYTVCVEVNLEGDFPFPLGGEHLTLSSGIVGGSNPVTWHPLEGRGGRNLRLTVTEFCPGAALDVQVVEAPVPGADFRALALSDLGSTHEIIRRTAFLPAAGTHWVRVSTPPGAGRTSYALRIGTFPSTADPDGNSTPPRAHPFVFDGAATLAGTLVPGDTDFVDVFVPGNPSGQPVILRLTANDADVRLTAWNAAGVRRTSDNPGVGVPEEVSVVPPEGAPIKVLIDRSPDADGLTGPTTYTLRLAPR